MQFICVITFVVGLVIGFIAGYIEREQSHKDNIFYESGMRATQLEEQHRLYKDNLRLEYMVRKFGDELSKHVKSPDVYILIEKIRNEAMINGINPQEGNYVSNE